MPWWQPSKVRSFSHATCAPQREGDGLQPARFPGVPAPQSLPLQRLLPAIPTIHHAI